MKFSDEESTGSYEIDNIGKKDLAEFIFDRKGSILRVFANFIRIMIFAQISIVSLPNSNYF